jgi:hypothetical protein
MLPNQSGNLPRGPREGKFVLYIAFQKYSKIKIFKLRRSIQKCIKTNQFPIGVASGFFPKRAGNLSGPF